MRKDEYLHLHALFVEVRDHLRRTGEVPPDAFAAYDARRGGPTGIHRRKDRHHEAIRDLRSGVRETIERRRDERTPALAARTD